MPQLAHGREERLDARGLEAALLEGPEPWLRRVLSGFGLRSQPRAGTDADLQQLVQFCADRLAAGSQSWLVIDDAQHMHEDVLQFRRADEK